MLYVSLTVDYEDGKSATTEITSLAPKEGEGKAVIKAGLLKGDYEGIVNERTTEFIVNVSKKPTELLLKVGNSEVELKEASSLEEFNNGENLYFYDEKPNLNKYATADSQFEDVEIITTPKLYVKAEKTNVKENEVELTINDFINDNGIEENKLNENLSIPGNIDIIKDTITGETIDLTWDAVEGATSYEVEVNGVIYRNIEDVRYQSRELEDEAKQSYRVRSVNEDGYSEWSDIITAETGFHKYKNVPENMKVLWTGGHWANQWVDYIVDGNDGTFFYTQAKANENPLIIDMNEECEIDKVEILGMTSANGSTGALKRIEIQTSLDGVNYETVYSNAEETGKPAWETDHKVKTAIFDKPVKARYVSIVTKESVSNRILLKEVRPYKVDKSNEVDKSELTKLVNEAENLVEANYTVESFAVVKEALLKAKQVLEEENISQVEIDEAHKVLEEAILGLVEAEIVVGKVQSLNKGEVTNNSVAISWKAPESTVGLVEYVIYQDGKELKKVPAEVSEVVISNLRANTIYGFKVAVKYSNDEVSKPVSINVRTKK